MSQVLALDIPSTPKYVLVALASHANDETGLDCFPSVRQVALEASLSERSVQYVLSELRDAGFLEVIRQGVGRGNRNNYRLTVEKGASDSLKGAPGRRKGASHSVNADAEKIKGASDAQKVHLTARKGASDSSVLKRTEPSLEPSLEPSQYSAAFAALGDVQGFKTDRKVEAKTAAFLERKGIPPEQAEDAANAILAKVSWERGKWVYHTASGKRSSGNLYGLLKNWAKRPPLPQRSYDNGNRQEVRTQCLGEGRVREGPGPEFSDSVIFD
ncbi:MAG: helix-turn-helix domain-containing protein [Dehalococcoidia bacterium]|nr:helix-turn-helix domain-containing protein [Dehalococcoidia bacterium]